MRKCVCGRPFKFQILYINSHHGTFQSKWHKNLQTSYLIMRIDALGRSQCRDAMRFMKMILITYNSYSRRFRNRHRKSLSIISKLFLRSHWWWWILLKISKLQVYSTKTTIALLIFYEWELGWTQNIMNSGWIKKLNSWNLVRKISASM